MKRIDKILKAIELGYTCNPELGFVYGLKNNILNRTDYYGYKSFKIRIDDKQVSLKEHQFIWFWVNKEVVDCIDHINGDRSDNRISNLRSINTAQNVWNRKDIKGCCYLKRLNKWQSRITVNRKSIYLGVFETPEQAKQAYLDAKKIYHNIKCL